MKSRSTSESHGSTSRKLDENSDLGSGEIDANSSLESTSSLGVSELPPKWTEGDIFTTQLDNNILMNFDHDHVRYRHDHKLLEDEANGIKSSLISVPALDDCHPILDVSIFELEHDSPGGYALLAFNVESIKLQPGGLLDWLLDDTTIPAFAFKDGSGFVKACLTVDQLHCEAFTIENILKQYGTPPAGLGQGLKPLLIATNWASLDMACYSLRTTLVDRTKEVALAACMRDVDWFVQATTAWPAIAADRDNLLSSLIDYLVVALGKAPIRDRHTSVLDMFCLVEVPAVSMNSVLLFLRLTPSFDSSDWAVGTIAQKLVSDCLMYRDGWSWNSISHFLHPACPDILDTESASGMSQFVESGSLTEAFIARRIDKSHDCSKVLHAHHNSERSAPRTVSENPVDFQRPSWNLEARHQTDLQNTFSPSRRHFTRPNSIDVERIYRGLDVRTTIMLRNLPNRLTHVNLYEHLLAACPGEFDFLYVRIDFSNGCNVGYGFVNMISPQSVIGFVESFRGFRWPGSEKVAEVSYATQQGREALISRFRNSSVMTQPETHRPKLYFPLGTPQAGLEEPFPKPDNLAKLHRSQQNADAEGLYETRGRRGVAAGRRRAGMLDPHHTHNGGEMRDFDPADPTPMTWPMARGYYRPGAPQSYLPASVGHQFRNHDSGYEDHRRMQPQYLSYGLHRRGGRANAHGH